MFRKKQRFFIAIDILLIVILLISLSKVLDIQVPNQTVLIEQEARKIANACLATEGDRENCYKEKFTQLTRDKDIFFTQKTLYAIQNIDPNLRHCHVISHEIAEAAVRKDPSKWRELMDQVDVDTCGAGFLHGILTGHVGDDPNFKIDAAFINETCYGGKLNFKERTCAHILGHLIILDTEGNIDPGLEICEKTHPNFSMDCYNGIFMEESFKLSLVEHGLAELPVRDEKRMGIQEKRCLKYDGKPGEACWIDMAEIFAEFYNYDAVKTYGSCNRAPHETQRLQCYLKAVIIMAVSPNYNSEDRLLSECAPYSQNEELYSRCTHYIISSLMHYSASFADRGVKLCTNINDKYRETCFKDLGDQLTMNTPQKSKRQELCRGTPEKYKSLCVN